VFCRCDPRIAARRYALRSGNRAAGHFDADRTMDRTIEKLQNDEVARPVAGDWPVIEVDTSRPVDIKPLAERIRAAAIPLRIPRHPRS
jgi:hypothetical protein